MRVKMKVISSKNLRGLIASKGYSIRDFSNHISISGAYMSDIVNENKQPSARIAWKIAQGLDVKISDIFFTVYDDKSETKEFKRSLTTS